MTISAFNNKIIITKKYSNKITILVTRSCKLKYAEHKKILPRRPGTTKYVSSPRVYNTYTG